jgi:hypothetical protein
MLPHPRHHLEPAGRVRRGPAAFDWGPEPGQTSLNTVLAALGEGHRAAAVAGAGAA